jgi:tetratricopeptide (TPR) repeat protein
MANNTRSWELDRIQALLEQNLFQGLEEEEQLRLESDDDEVPSTQLEGEEEEDYFEDDGEEIEENEIDELETEENFQGQSEFHFDTNEFWVHDPENLQPYKVSTRPSSVDAQFGGLSRDESINSMLSDADRLFSSVPGTPTGHFDLLSLSYVSTPTSQGNLPISESNSLHDEGETQVLPDDEGYDLDAHYGIQGSALRHLLSESTSIYHTTTSPSGDPISKEDQSHQSWESEDTADSQEEYESAHRDALRTASGVGIKRVKRGKRRNDPNLDPTVKELIGKANQHYFLKEYQLAMDACQSVVRLQPRADKAYKIMGLIWEESKEWRRALTMYLIMAHLVPKDYDLWRQLAVFAREHGTEREMIHCYRKASSANPKEMSVPWKLIQYYESRGQVSPQIDLYRHLLRAAPYHMIFVRNLVSILLDKGEKQEAANILKQALKHHSKGKFSHPWLPPSVEDLKESIIESSQGFCTIFERVEYASHTMPCQFENFSVESGACCMDDVFLITDVLLNEKDHLSLLLIVKGLVRFLQGRLREESTWERNEHLDDSEYGIRAPSDRDLTQLQEHPAASLPIEIRIILGVCRLHLNQLTLAQAHFKFLSADTLLEREDLFEMMIQSYLDCGFWLEGLTVLDTLLDLELPGIVMNEIENNSVMSIEDPEPFLASLWYKRGQCLSNLGNRVEAIKSFHTSAYLDLTFSSPLEELGALYQLEGNHDRAYEYMTAAERRIDNTNVDSILFARSVTHGKPRGPRRKRKSQSGNDDFELPLASDALLRDVSKQATTERERITRKSTRKRGILEKEKEIRLKFEKMELVWDRFDALDVESKNDYLMTATSIFEVFRNTGAFYPCDRTVTFAGVDTSGRIRNTKIRKAKFLEDGEYKMVERRMFLGIHFFQVLLSSFLFFFGFQL